MLCEEFTAVGISIKQADNDANVLIIETAIEQLKDQIQLSSLVKMLIC